MNGIEKFFVDKIDRAMNSKIVDGILRIPIVDKILRPDGHPRIAGVYSSQKSCAEAITKLKSGGFKVVVHSPVFSHEIESAVGGDSIVRYFTFFGAALGGILGFALAAWSSLKWNLIVGGKPILSIPPFMIIFFECTILLGALGTFAGFFHSTRLPQIRLDEIYRDAFGEDKFGIGVVCAQSELERAEKALRDAGAEEVYFAKA